MATDLEPEAVLRSPDANETLPVALEPYPKTAWPILSPVIPRASESVGPAILLKPKTAEPTPEALL